MGKGNGGRTGRAWNTLRAQVLAEETHCAAPHCHHPTSRWVDQTIPYPQPWSPTAGHIIEVDQAPNLLLERTNLRLEHWRCNTSAGATYGNKKRSQTPTRPNSREW